MIAVRNELSYMQLPERYLKVKLKGQGGPVCICTPQEVRDFCDGGEDEYEFEDVFMTQAEVEALAEFEGF